MAANKREHKFKMRPKYEHKRSDGMRWHGGLRHAPAQHVPVGYASSFSGWLDKQVNELEGYVMAHEDDALAKQTLWAAYGLQAKLFALKVG